MFPVVVAFNVVIPDVPPIFKVPRFVREVVAPVPESADEAVRIPLLVTVTPVTVI
ncbi:hypothetical protein D3C85_1090110 [compost metagenome]